MSTFSSESNLPSLPVPKIEDTLKHYDACQKAVLCENDYVEFKKVLDKFISSGRAEYFQNKFLEKFVKNNYGNGPTEQKNGENGENQIPRNWLELLWQEKAYTDNRYPLYFVNFGGLNPQSDRYHPSLKDLPGSEHHKNEHRKSAGDFDFDHISTMIYSICKYWYATYNETLEPHEFRGIKWSMDMILKFWNSAHVPGETSEKDQLKAFFGTKSGNFGNPDSKLEEICNFTLNVNGLVFLVPFVDAATGKLFSRSALKQILQETYEKCSETNQEPVNKPTIFTADLMYRHDVFSFRKDLDANSLRNLQKIDRSAFAITLDLGEPVFLDEILRASIFGNGNNRIHNKSYGLNFFKSGYSGSYSCHSMCEGMANIFAGFAMDKIFMIPLKKIDQMDAENNWPDASQVSSSTQITGVEKLDFHIPENWTDQLQKAEAIYRNHFADKLKAKLHRVPIGKKHLRPLKIHPGAFSAMVNILAFYKMHKFLPSVYETAQLRQFYNGRSETFRVMQESMKNWIMAMCDEKNPNPQKMKETFIEAHKNYLLGMVAATNFQACDRHLLALSSLDEECELITHPSYKTGGGGGNFYISSSSLGSDSDKFEGIPKLGGCAPFREDGYGIFNGNTENFLNFCVWWYGDNDKVDGDKFLATIEKVIMGLVKNLGG